MDSIKTLHTGAFEDGFLLAIHVDNLIHDKVKNNWEFVSVHYTSFQIEEETEFGAIQTVTKHSAWITFRLD